MLKLDRFFLLGSIKDVYRVTSSCHSPLELILEKTMEIESVDGVISAKKDKDRAVPHLFLPGERIELPSPFYCFGINTLLKKAVQKYHLSKVAVVAPSCVMDGLNKTQYYGIGCNWVKTAVALKVGVLCTGLTTEEALRCEVLDLLGRRAKVRRSFYCESGLVYELESGELLPVELEVHHRYINTGCRYCFNLSARGSDITAVPTRHANQTLLLVRSERGRRMLSLIQRIFPGLLSFSPADEEELSSLEETLRRKMLFNVDAVLERVEAGLPGPKWDGSRFRKFYRMWNALSDYNIGEEVY
jgi:coenzyme F420 hydrogenase subunit beta